MPRWFAVSTRGVTRYDSVQFADGDAFVFGPETRGLPQAVLEECPPRSACGFRCARAIAA